MLIVAGDLSQDLKGANPDIGRLVRSICILLVSKVRYVNEGL